MTNSNVKLLSITVKTIFIAGLMAPQLTGQVTQIVGNRGIRECASCHVEWIESFDQPRAILLMEKPDKPMRAESETCLSCHDGSMVDSRRRVWLEHGHQTDLIPPPGMRVPDDLPLEDGKIVCRTCHTAHISQNPVNLDNPVFLRVLNDKSQLCMMCHPDNIPKENSHITHPLGDMPEPIPEVLIQAGARALPDERQVHCQVCHTPHGSKQDHLLVMGANNNNLCLTCHSEKRPGMWHGKQKIPHPDRPIITSEIQHQAIDNMGARHGDDNRLICLSCHRMHDGKSGKFMLAMSLEDSAFCIQCHPDQVDLMQTKHNPRIFAYGIENLEGVTIDQAGPCSACHMFHSIAQPPNPSEYDPQGICLSCHSREGIAGKTGAQHGQLTNTHPLNIPVPNMLPDQVLPLFEN